MRNLKRVLSLTLASVMLLGMMVVGSSAAQGFPDVDDEDNVEAIEVVQAVNIMIGDENGNFNPNDPVTRAEMAVIIAGVLELDYDYYASVCPFTDVPEWARGCVGACFARRIVSGRSDTVYDPSATVTAVEASSMLMRALGYFQYNNDFADGFELSTVRQGTNIGIYDGVGSSAVEPMTRNQVAQMVLNALQSGVVQPDGNTINLTTPDGNVYTGKVNYVYVTSRDQSYATAISDLAASAIGSSNDGWIVELGEQQYKGDLELNDKAQDDFGRPARTWLYKGTEIGTYAKTELLRASYTKAVTGREVYELLGQTIIGGNELLTYLDGANNTNITRNTLVRSNTSDLNGTGKGVLTEIYLDKDYDKLYIVSINTWLAQAAVDYNEKSESITLTVYNGENSSITKWVDVEDVPYIANMKKDDWCLVQWVGDSLTSHTDREVVKAFDVEILEDQEVTGFKRSEEEYFNYGAGRVGRVTEVITGGSTYENNAQAWYKYNTLNEFNNSELVNKTYTLYMDQYGYFIGAELYSGSNQYVFITGYDRDSSNISVNTSKASGIFTDGTIRAIDVNVKDTNENITSWKTDKAAAIADDYNVWTALGNNGNNLENKWYKYTEDKGVYTLTPVDKYTRETETKQTTLDCSNVYLTTDTVGNVTDGQAFGTGRSFGDESSIYITVENGDVDTAIGGNSITDVTGLYTGAQNVKLVVDANKWVHAVYEDNDIVAAIVWGEAQGTVDNYIYVRGGVSKEWKETESTRDGSTVVHYWEFDAVRNGEKTTEVIKSKFPNTGKALVPGTVQELITDADGYVTKIRNIPDEYNVTGSGYVAGDITDVNKVFGNDDFNAYIGGSNVYLKGYKIYNIMTQKNQWVSTGINLSGGKALSILNSGTNNVNLFYKDYTMSFSDTTDNVGLVVTKDAKAVVSQRINGKTEWENYPSVEAAYQILNDADTTPGNGKQFDGQIVAVLDADGRAVWMVFNDNTPTNIAESKPGQVITGELVGATAELKEVNRLLSEGKNVTVDGPWTPSDLSNTNKTVYLPNNQTLTILGNFSAFNNNGSGIDITIQKSMISGTPGKIVVGDPNGTAASQNATFTTVQDTIDFQVQAQNMRIGQNDGGSTRTISAPVVVNKNLNVEGVTLKITSTLNAETITRKVGTEKLVIEGTVTVDNLEISADVDWPSTLIVKVAAGVTNAITINVGSTTTNGKAIIKTLGSKATLIVKNKDASTEATTVETNEGIVNVTSGKATIEENQGTATATAGTLEIETNNGGTTAGAEVEQSTSGTVKSGEVETVDKNTTIDIPNNGTLIVTKSLDTADIHFGTSSNLILRAGVVIGPNAYVVNTDVATAAKVTGTLKEEDEESSTGSNATGALVIEDTKFTTGTIVAVSPTDGQPTNKTEAQVIILSEEDGWVKELADYVTVGLKETYESGENGGKGTISLSGKVQTVNGVTMSEVAMTDWAGPNVTNETDKTRGWYDAREYTSVPEGKTYTDQGFQTLYDLEGKEFGFIMVSVDNNVYIALVVYNPDESHNDGWYIVVRNSTNGNLTYLKENKSSSWVGYTVNIDGLTR